jgi:hypothetical protein
MHAIKNTEPTMDKAMRMHSVTSTIENGFVHLPEKAAWLGEYLQELAVFPNGKYGDQVDSTSLAPDWFKTHCTNECYGLLDLFNEEEAKMRAGQPSIFDTPENNLSRRTFVRGSRRWPSLDVLQNIDRNLERLILRSP